MFKQGLDNVWTVVVDSPAKWCSFISMSTVPWNWECMTRPWVVASTLAPSVIRSWVTGSVY